MKALICFEILKTVTHARRQQQSASYGYSIRCTDRKDQRRGWVQLADKGQKLSFKFLDDADSEVGISGRGLQIMVLSARAG